VSLLDKVRALDNEYHFMNVYAEDSPVGSGLLDSYAVSVKDNVCVKGVESKAGSKILEGYVPPFDATVVS
jgi:Asp-tRNA(Asn)/Glu-tRNA(Gln) amidotransferase A subunit family amidase